MNSNEIKSRRNYTAEFKQDAVNRVLRTGKSCAEVGRELGINLTLFINRTGTFTV